MNNNIETGMATTELTGLLIVLVSLLILLSIITILGNAIVILVVLKDPCQNLKSQWVAIVFIVNLAIADLLLGLVIEPIFCVLLLSSVSTKKLDFITTALSFTVEASCLTLVALGIQRWIVVEMPIKAMSIQTRTRIAITIGAIWFLAGLLASLAWPGLVTITDRSFDYITFDIVGSLLIITLMCVYGRIWVLVRRSTSFRRIDITTSTKATEVEQQPLMAEKQEQGYTRKERILEAKMTQTFYIVCGAFIICWLPASLYGNICGTNHTVYFRLCLLAGLLNSALNPLIYSLRSDRFKQALKKMLQRSRRR